MTEYFSNLEDVNKIDAFCQVGDTFCQQPAKADIDAMAFNPIIAGFEKDMKDSLLGKVMENFENAMLKETKKFDEMKRETDKRELLLEKQRNWQHIPATLRNEGVNTRELWERVSKLVIELQSGDENSKREYDVSTIKSETFEMILSHGIGAWLSTLNRNHYNQFVQKIYSEICQWISKIWRFRCSASYFHHKIYEGILSVCKVALATRFPKFQYDGYSALFSHQPVIYLNRAADPALVDYLQINLGLPSDCINLVPNYFESGGNESMDVAILDKLVLYDIMIGKVPLILCAYAGSTSTDSMDDMTAIHKLCKRHQIWLHVEGFRLSELALVHVPAKVNTICSEVKSMTLDLGQWLGIASVPLITLVTTTLPESYLRNLGFGSGYFIHNRVAMDIFPLWMCLQMIGHDGIVNKVENQMTKNYSIVKRLIEIPNIKLLSGRTQSPSTNNEEFSPEVIHSRHVIDSVLILMNDGQQIPFVVVFRYNPPQHANGFCNGDSDDSSSQQSQSLLEADVEEEQTYLDSLNHWLAKNLMISYAGLNITMITLPSEGLCVRLCLQESSIAITEDLLDRFSQSVREHMAIIHYTLLQRTRFKDSVKTRNQVLVVNLPKWAGLGCLQFIPEIYRKDLFTLPSGGNPQSRVNFKELTKILSEPNKVEEINKLNKMLAEQLRNEDSAFSMGFYDFVISKQSAEHNADRNVSLACIRLGLITGTTTVDHLLQLVIGKGEEVEVSTRNLEKMSLLVKVGIDRVTEHLAKVQEDKLRQEGVLRQVPYLDSIVNWIYPNDKTPVVGRTLNLSSGEIQPTEDTYKYKIQLQNCIRPIATETSIETPSDPLPVCITE